MLNFRISMVVSVSALLLTITLHTFGQSGPNRMQKRQEKENASLNTITALLREHNESAIMAYRCVCKDHVMIGLQFPLVKSKRQGSDVLKALESLLSSSDRNFTVSKDSDGVVRLAEEDVRQDVLSIRVHKVSFNKSEQIDPNAAMRKILDSPEVRRYFNAKRIETPVFEGGLVPRIIEHTPRLRPELNDVTVQETIKEVLKTFPNLALYRECADSRGRRIVSINFM